MADNVVITPGVGSTIGADEVADATLGTVHVQYVKLMDGTIDGTNKGVINANGLKVDGSGVTQPVSAASLPLPTGASTAAKQPALGTAGTASADVITVQGIASMTALQSAQSGTWTVQPGNTANTTAWKVQLYDGTTALPVLAGSSGPPAASAPALAVSVRDANANGQATMANSAPVTFASDQTFPVKASTTINGTTRTRIVSAATTNATSVKASAGKVLSLRIFNVAAYDVYFKFYDKASAPTVGTDTPTWTIPLKAGTGFSENFVIGDDFTTGIAYAITKLQADSDTTVIAAGDVTGKINWI